MPFPWLRESSVASVPWHLVAFLACLDYNQKMYTRVRLYSEIAA